MTPTLLEPCSAKTRALCNVLRGSLGLAIFLASTVVAATSPVQASEPVRIWVDETGLHSIEASLQSITDGVALLKRANGTKVNISVAQLSQVDRDYIESWTDHSALRENHLRWTPPVLPELVAQPVLELPPASSLLDEGQPLAPLSGPAPTKNQSFPSSLLPDPQAFAIALTFGKQTLGKIHSYDSCSPPLAIATPTQTFLAVSISTGLSSTPSPNANRIVRFDPATGNVSTVLQSNQPITILDHHQASGRTLVLNGHRVMGQGGELAIAKGWDDDTLTIQYSRALPNIGSANAGSSAHTRQLHWARWVDGEHVVASINGEIAVWNLLSGQCLHRVCNVQPKVTPAISAGRRYIAVPTSVGVELYQTSDGSSLGTIPIESGRSAQVSFSPRGDSLAIITTSRLRVWELSSATLRGEAKSQRSLGKGAPVWIDTDLVLSSTGVLLSIYRGVPVWRYDLLGSTINAYGVASPNKGIGLLSWRPHGEIGFIEIPHETARQSFAWVDEQLMTNTTARWDLPGKSVLGEDGWADRELRFAQREDANR